MAVPSMTDIIDIISTVIKCKLRQRERMSIRKTTIQVGFVDIISSFSQQVANPKVQRDYFKATEVVMQRTADNQTLLDKSGKDE